MKYLITTLLTNAPTLSIYKFECTEEEYPARKKEEEDFVMSNENFEEAIIIIRKVK